MGLNSNIKMINSTTCHCCSFNVFKSIIKDRAIRLCDMRNSNDPKEVIAASEYILSLIDKEYIETKNKKYLYLKENFKRELPSFNPYVVSFTNLVNDTIFMRYAENGEGVGINFHSSKFGIGIYLVNDHKDIYYVPIFYDPEDSKGFAMEVINAYLEEKIQIQKATLELLKISCMYKTREWKDEKEIRIYYIPSEKKLLGEKCYFEKQGKKRSYYNLTFDKFDKENIVEDVILGPNFNMNDIPKVKELLDENGFGYVSVYSYEKAYKESLEKVKELGY
ncbi:MAG: DUF2971 domain-containing protein [Clostridium sp.]|nr:DUF2971 domain-containing protein [Clostridium sp.]